MCKIAIDTVGCGKQDSASIIHRSLIAPTVFYQTHLLPSWEEHVICCIVSGREDTLEEAVCTHDGSVQCRGVGIGVVVAEPNTWFAQHPIADAGL